MALRDGLSALLLGQLIPVAFYLAGYLVGVGRCYLRERRTRDRAVRVTAVG